MVCCAVVRGGGGVSRCCVGSDCAPSLGIGTQASILVPVAGFRGQRTENLSPVFDWQRLSRQLRPKHTDFNDTCSFCCQTVQYATVTD